MLNLLLDEVSSDFSKYRRSCLKNVLILALALLRKETLCLHRLKSEVGLITGRTDTQAGSHCKRLIRIFDFSLARPAQVCDAAATAQKRVLVA